MEKERHVGGALSRATSATWAQRNPGGTGYKQKLSKSWKIHSNELGNPV